MKKVIMGSRGEERSLELLYKSKNKSVRFPNDVVKKVEDAITGEDSTFSAFVIAAVKNALEELEEK